MERARAAAALLCLAACVTLTATAPVNEQTGLDVYDNGAKDGCYYNFQHYGEGDRITTNEPCLNCTCHNRMLMCYLRVCPFTKPIGQDCTVEKRGDQCCPVITCPDVRVDLLTSTSTTSPAEYGSSDVGHLDKYGCSIGGKFFSEGSKVPPNPSKPCELCYCIRNMTACVMQECTLHVDGCTPVYQKDVCCPVRYSCDHPEDEILMLDDMTTTVRPTQGFLLTTTAAPDVTQDCIHQDQVFADGALIKTEKACEHCYCMKGDIVCVVQECGMPMENEGKNCTSLPPREGQCCPDTYICEGDTIVEDTTDENELPTTPILVHETVSPGGMRDTSEGVVPTVTTLSPLGQEEGSGHESTTTLVNRDEALADQDHTAPIESPTTLNTFSSTEEDVDKRHKTTSEYEINTTTNNEIGPEILTSEIPTSTISLEREESTPKSADQDVEYPKEQLPLEESSTSDTPQSIPEESSTISEQIQQTTTPSSISSTSQKESAPKLDEQPSEMAQPSEIPDVSQIDQVSDKSPQLSVSSTEKEETSEINTQESIQKATTPFAEYETQHTTPKEEHELPLSTEIPAEKSTDLSDKFGEEPLGTQKYDDDSVSHTTSEPVTHPIESETVQPENDFTDKPDTSNTHDISTESIQDQTTPVLFKEKEEELTEKTTQPSSLEISSPKLESDLTTIHVSETTQSLTESSETSSAVTKEPQVTAEHEDTTPAIVSTSISAESSPELEDNSPTTLSSQTESYETPTTQTYIEELHTMTPTDSNIRAETTTNSVKTQTKESSTEKTQSSDASSTESTTSAFEPSESLYTEKSKTTDKPDKNSDAEQSTFSSVDETVLPQEYSSPTVSEQETPTTNRYAVSETTDNILEGVPEISTTNVPREKPELEPELQDKTTTVKSTEETGFTSQSTASDLDKTTLTEVSHETNSDDSVKHTTEAISTIPDDTLATVVPDQSENEIEEEETGHILPHIPGEGDCLVDGTTYSNDSYIPSTNKCQTSCKCVSSIVKCDSIQCNPPSEDMTNCQPIHDAKESCCPTYICDQPKKTISPESHNQVLESSTPLSSLEEKLTTPTNAESPAEECKSGNCEAIEEQIVPVQVSELCSSESCSPSTNDSLPNRAADDLSPIQHNKPDTDKADDQPKEPQEELPVIPVVINEECTEQSCQPNRITPEAPRPTSESVTKSPAQSCISENCEITQGTTEQTEICIGESCKKIDTLPSLSTCEGENCQAHQAGSEPEVPSCQGNQCEQNTKSPVQSSSIPERQPSIAETQTGFPELPINVQCEGMHCEQIPQAPSTSEILPILPCEGNNCDQNIPQTSEDYTEAPKTPEILITQSGSATQLPEASTILPESQSPTKEPESATGPPKSPESVPKSETELPQPPTSIPESETSLPESATNEPESATSVPESPTSVPEHATGQPESPTSTPEPAIGQPESATIASKSETSVPEAPTSALESETGLPESPTSAPEFTTERLQSPISAPESPTDLPESPTSIPEPGTNVPESSTTIVPVSPTSASESATSLPESAANEFESATSIPESPTSVPKFETGQTESPTSLPESETSLPESSSSKHESAFSAPESPTSVPEYATGQPESPTSSTEPAINLPESTTNAPKSETGIPETPTSALESETGLPESPTSAPEFTTGLPQSSASIPESATSLPESATYEPESATSVPESPTSIPDFETGQTESHTSLPESATSLPESPSSKPESAFSVPEYPTSAPEYATGQPELPTSAPEPAISLPESTTIIPKSETSVPESQTSTLRSGTSTSESPTNAPEFTTGMSESPTHAPEFGTGLPESFTSKSEITTGLPEFESKTKIPKVPESEQTTSIPQSPVTAPAPEVPFALPCEGDKCILATQIPVFSTGLSVSTTAPEFSTDLPEYSSRAPQSEETPAYISQSQTSLPDSTTEVPEKPSSQHEFGTELPKTPENIPESVNAVPDTQTSVPVTTCEGDQCEQNHEAPNKPEVVSNLPCEGNQCDKGIPQPSEDSSSTETSPNTLESSTIIPDSQTDISHLLPGSTCDGDQCNQRPQIPTEVSTPSSEIKAPCQGNQCKETLPNRKIPEIDNSVPHDSEDFPKVTNLPETTSSVLCEGGQCDQKTNAPEVSTQVEVLPKEPEVPVNPTSIKPCEGDECKLSPQIPSLPCDGGDCYTAPHQTTEESPKVSTTFDATAVSEASTSQPKDSTYRPESEISIPTASTSLPDFETSVPELSTSFPESGTGAPTIPESVTGLPEAPLSVPESTPRISEAPTSMPDAPAQQSEHIPKEPEVFGSTPESMASVPEIYASTPDTSNTLSESTTLKPEFTSDKTETPTTSPEMGTGLQEAQPPVPGSTTSISASPTSEMESTTGLPEVSSSVPETATGISESPASEPELATDNPDSLTIAPESVSVLPESPSTSPGTDTRKQESPIDAPESATGKPESATGQQETSTNVPESPPGLSESPSTSPETVTELPETPADVSQSATGMPESPATSLESATGLPGASSTLPETVTGPPETPADEPESATGLPESSASFESTTGVPVTLAGESDFATGLTESDTSAPEFATDLPESPSSAPGSENEIPKLPENVHESETSKPDVPVTVNDLPSELQCEGKQCTPVTQPSSVPEVSSIIPCEGDQCDKVAPQSPEDITNTPTLATQSTCKGNECKQVSQTATDFTEVPSRAEASTTIPEVPTSIPEETCKGDKCSQKPQYSSSTEVVPKVPCEGINCDQIASNLPRDTTTSDCKGSSCPPSSSSLPTSVSCEGDKCDQATVAIKPVEPVALCDGRPCSIAEESTIPQIPCEGDQCSLVNKSPEVDEDCKSGECKPSEIPKTPEQAECTGDLCSAVPPKPCSGSECDFSPIKQDPLPTTLSSETVTSLIPSDAITDGPHDQTITDQTAQLTTSDEYEHKEPLSTPQQTLSFESTTPLNIEQQTQSEIDSNDIPVHSTETNLPEFTENEVRKTTPTDVRKQEIDTTSIETSTEHATTVKNTEIDITTISAIKEIKPPASDSHTIEMQPEEPENIPVVISQEAVPIDAETITGSGLPNDVTTPQEAEPVTKPAEITIPIVTVAPNSELDERLSGVDNEKPQESVTELSVKPETVPYEATETTRGPPAEISTSLEPVTISSQPEEGVLSENVSMTPSKDVSVPNKEIEMSEDQPSPQQTTESISEPQSDEKLTTLTSEVIAPTTETPLSPLPGKQTMESILPVTTEPSNLDDNTIALEETTSKASEELQPTTAFDTKIDSEKDITTASETSELLQTSTASYELSSISPTFTEHAITSEPSSTRPEVDNEFTTETELEKVEPQEIVPVPSVPSVPGGIDKTESSTQGEIIEQQPTTITDETKASTPSTTAEQSETTNKITEDAIYTTQASQPTEHEKQKPASTDDLPPTSSGPGELPSPGEDTEHQTPEQFPAPGYGEPDYEEEDQAFGPGTCRYGGKVYVSAQQIPRDDPCDFCFCFRSDIICLQQSCPPPIHGCHEEPISGFCCPRYECPVSMATTLNVTTTTTTTTTTLPPHFLPHAYKGAAQRRGCQIKGHTYAVGEVVRSSSGPCLHCTCGGDGQMKCDPKVCTPEPMLRQMIAAAVSTRRRR